MSNRATAPIIRAVTISKNGPSESSESFTHMLFGHTQCKATRIMSIALIPANGTSTPPTP
jgi:ribosomal protein S11